MAPSVQRRKVWLTPTTSMPCSNVTKTLNPLTLAVPQTNETISAASGPKFTIHVEETLLLTSFFPIVETRLSCEDIARQICAMVSRWRIFGDFLILRFQRAACSTFQTCILNSQLGHNMCRSMVDIQSATADIRRGIKKKKEERNHRQKYNVRISCAGRP